MDAKRLVGEKAVEYIKDGMVVGLGMGSTVYYTLLKLGELVKEGLDIKGIPTSVQTEQLAKELRIPLLNSSEMEYIDVTIDGADEVDPDFALIKGGGGALLREKIIANASEQFIVVATREKMVKQLGDFGIPVEVIPFCVEFVKEEMKRIGLNPVLREQNGHPFKTDNGNYVVDCSVSEPFDPKEMEMELNMIPGVVENGLFNDMVDIVVSLDDEKNVVVMKR